MIPVEKTPKPRPKIASFIRKAERAGAFIPSFMGGTPTPTERRAEAKAMADSSVLDRLIEACPAFSRDGSRHFQLKLSWAKKMGPILTELTEKEWVWQTKSWRFKVDAAPKVLPHLDVIREVWEEHLPYQASDFRAPAAIETARKLLKDDWWLLTKGNQKLLEDIVAKTILNTAEVKVVKAIEARAAGKLDKIAKTFEDGDLADSPELFGPDRMDAMKEACVMLADLDPDRAKICNGAGFTTTDTEKGHYIARVPDWKMSHAYVAHRMLKKYWRQLPKDLFGRIYG